MCESNEKLLAEQRASGNFADGACLKCRAKFHINLRYPQVICTGLIDHKYCGGTIEKTPLAGVFIA